MGGLLFSEEERVQDRGSGKVNAELWASEFGVKDWVEAAWGALSGSSVKFLDRLLIISYYQVMAVTETKVIISACWMASNTGTVGCTTAASWLSPVCSGDAIDGISSFVPCQFQTERKDNWCERKNNLCAIWMRIWIIKGHIHIPLLLSYSMIAIVKRNAKKYHWRKVARHTQYE